MTANERFYTYVHRKADTGEVFYVGKGMGQRSHTIYNRTKYWRHVVAKHGLIVEIVKTFHIEADALSSEIAMIAAYRAEGVALVNLTVGGEGASGQVFTEERKQKISAALKGKTISAEVREKISKALKGRICPPRTDIHKLRLSESQKGRVFTDEHKAAIKKAMDGLVVVCSEETRRKLSESSRGRIKSPETIAKLRLVNVGKKYALGLKRSAETLIKMSIAQKARKPSEAVLEKRRIAALRVYTVSDEARMKMSKSQIARWAARKSELASQI